MHNSHHMCNGWSSIGDQPSTLINMLHILHVTRTEEWAQPDWIAASVSLIPPEELWDQVLINGTEDTSSLLWRSSISVCMKHCFDTATQHNNKTAYLTKSCKIQHIGQRTVQVQPDPIHFRHVSDNLRCIYSVDWCQHSSQLIFQKYFEMTIRQQIIKIRNICTNKVLILASNYWLWCSFLIFFTSGVKDNLRGRTNTHTHARTKMQIWKKKKSIETTYFTV